jgi:putative transcriptional regulator
VGFEMIRWLLAKRMQDKGISVQELARRTELHINTIYNLRKQEGMPSISGEALDKLCDALNCTPQDLIEHVPERKILEKNISWEEQAKQAALNAVMAGAAVGIAVAVSPIIGSVVMNMMFGKNKKVDSKSLNKVEEEIQNLHKLNESAERLYETISPLIGQREKEQLSNLDIEKIEVSVETAVENSLTTCLAAVLSNAVAIEGKSYEAE